MGPDAKNAPRVRTGDSLRRKHSHDVRVPIRAMKPSMSVPDFPRRDDSMANLGQSLLRRHSTSDRLFNDMPESPLFDLAPLALPGLSSRVSRNFSVSRSLDEIGSAFDDDGDDDKVVRMEVRLPMPLLKENGVWSSVTCWLLVDA